MKQIFIRLIILTLLLSNKIFGSGLWITNKTSKPLKGSYENVLGGEGRKFEIPSNAQVDVGLAALVCAKKLTISGDFKNKYEKGPFCGGGPSITFTEDAQGNLIASER